MAKIPNEIFSKPQSPKVGDTHGRPRSWSFSFQYFNQIKYFGLDKTSITWFASLLERLKDLSQNRIEDFMRDHAKRQSYRYHEVDWNLHNVPIKRKDLNWIPSQYLDNEEECVFLQFQVSTANGRIVGFWNEDSTIFHIVLLDPHHNIQPSKHYSYKVDDCYPLSSQYSSLHKSIDDVLRVRSCNEDCPMRKEVSNVLSKQNNTNVVCCYLDDDYYQEFEKKIKGKSVSEIIELGLLSDK